MALNRTNVISFAISFILFFPPLIYLFWDYFLFYIFVFGLSFLTLFPSLGGSSMGRSFLYGYFFALVVSLVFGFAILGLRQPA